MVVTLVAIQLAGAAYLPLDPMLPAERCATMLRAANAAAVVTHSSLLSPLAPHLPPGTATLLLDAIPAGTAAAEELQGGAAECDNSCDDGCAYVIFTSGSTGCPKGVPILHSALENLLEAFTQEVCSHPIPPGLSSLVDYIRSRVQLPDMLSCATTT